MTLAIVLVGCFLGFLSSSTTGVGGALVMLPMLTLIVPANTAVALSTPVMLVNNVGKLALLRGSLDRVFLRYTMIGAVPGVFVGSLLLGVVPDSIVRRGIGIFLLVYVAISLFAPSYVPRVGRLGAVGWGAATGVISGLIGAGGPTSSAAMRGYGLDRKQLVATGAAMSVGMQLIKLPIFAAIGLIDVRHLPLLVALSVVALLAAYAGRALLARMDAVIFERVLMVALLALGLAMTLGSKAPSDQAAGAEITMASGGAACDAIASEGP